MRGGMGDGDLSGGGTSLVLSSARGCAKSVFVSFAASIGYSRCIEMFRFELKKRPFLIITAVSLALSMAVVTACGGDDEQAAAEQRKAEEEAKKKAAAAAAGTAFVPVDPATQPGLPPGAGPYNGPPPKEDPPPVMDAGKDTTTPPADTSPPQDASGQ